MDGPCAADGGYGLHGGVHMIGRENDIGNYTAKSALLSDMHIKCQYRLSYAIRQRGGESSAAMVFI